MMRIQHTKMTTSCSKDEVWASSSTCLMPRCGWVMGWAWVLLDMALRDTALGVGTSRNQPGQELIIRRVVRAESHLHARRLQRLRTARYSMGPR